MSGGLPARPRSGVVVVGDEILLGRTVDTNGAWLAERLAEIGAPVVRKVTVGDRDADIRAALEEALETTEVVIFSGGLGPTADDRTREAVAEALGVELRLDPIRLEALGRRFAGRGYDELPSANRSQALVPEGGEALENPIGTAPGLLMEEGGRLVVLLPGVPRELRGIFPQVESRIRARFGDRLEPVETLTVHTTGIPESVLGPMVSSAMAEEPVAVAFLPELTGVDIRLTASGPDAAAELEQGRAVLTSVVGRYIVPGASGDLAEAVLEALRRRGLRLGLAESCTGGLVSKRLTDIPGSSEVLSGGVVTYSNEAKERMLGVPTEALVGHGAVSEPVARAMAEGAARSFGVECGIGITGIAGPGGGSEDKPVGSVHYAVCLRERTESRHVVFPGDRAAVRERAAQAALALLLEVVEGDA